MRLALVILGAVVAGCSVNTAIPSSYTRAAFVGMTCADLQANIEHARTGLRMLEGSYGAPVAVIAGDYKGRINGATAEYNLRCV